VRAVVTGANGFVAGHLIDHLLDEGDTVLALTRTNGCQIPLSENLTTGVWDITRPASTGMMQQIREFNPEVVFHLAAISVRSRCGNTEPSEEAMLVNVQGSRHVADCCLQMSLIPKLVFTSSVYVYGSCYDQITQVSEGNKTSPDNGYGISKLLAEQILMEYGSVLPLIIARSFQHTGPRQKGSLLIPEWVHKLQTEPSPLEVYNLQTWIDYSDARDVAKAYRILATQASTGEVFNVGSGNAIRSGEILDTLQVILGTSKQVSESKPGKNFLPIADIKKIQSQTDWRAEYTMKQTLQDFVNELNS
tara:strand:+ start:3554 stop:4468 length:915 start_codon:yes stop_codon:yes gene_type:complete